MRVRQWRLQGAEIVITLTSIPDGEADGKRLHWAVAGFSRALGASTAGPEGFGVPQGAITPLKD